MMDLIENVRKKFQWEKFLNLMEKEGFIKLDNQRLTKILLQKNAGKMLNLGNLMIFNSKVFSNSIRDVSFLHLNPFVIFQPKNIQQLRKIVVNATKLKIPITFAGGKTGLSGAFANFGIIVDLAHLKTMEKGYSVDLKRGLLKVDQSFLVCQLINLIPRETNGKYIFPVQPSSAFKLPVRVGGILANDASGITSGKLGSAIDWVEELTIMKPDGKIINVKKTDKSFSKYVGGNGYFGIILTVLMRLYVPSKKVKHLILFGTDLNALANGLQELLFNKIFPLVCELVVSFSQLPGKFEHLKSNLKSSNPIKWALLIKGSEEELSKLSEIIQKETTCFFKFLKENEFDEFLSERTSLAIISLDSKNSSDYLGFPGFEDILCEPKYLVNIMNDINSIFLKNGFPRLIFGYGHVNFRKGKGLLFHVRLPVSISLLSKNEVKTFYKISKTIFEVITNLKNKYNITYKAEHGGNVFKIWLDENYRIHLKKAINKNQAFNNPHLILYEELYKEFIKNTKISSLTLENNREEWFEELQEEIFLRLMTLYLHSA